MWSMRMRYMPMWQKKSGKGGRGEVVSKNFISRNEG